MGRIRKYSIEEKKEIQKEWNKQYYIKNKEKINAHRMKKYYDKKTTK
jgi:hypothetical protein